MMRLTLCAMFLAASATQAQTPYAEIRVVDAETGRGVPLVELETTNHLLYVTDNAGRVAFHEPGLMDREIYFFVRSHGYEAAKDGFGFAGAKITPRAGQVATIKLMRRNIAERLCRLTGEGLYRDTVLLGHKAPFGDRKNEGRVAGQDSVQAAIHRGKIHWFWGDTSRMEYPLGLFRSAGATTRIFDPAKAGDDPASGIAYEYFVDKTDFARAMMPLAERPEGVIWITGVCTAPDRNGKERMVAFYARRKGLKDELEYGIAVFNDDKQLFEPIQTDRSRGRYRMPHTHAVRWKDGDSEWMLFGSPSPNVRVRAKFEELVDPAKYEVFTAGGQLEDEGLNPKLDDKGVPQWRWQADGIPTGSDFEKRWVKRGNLKPEHARYYPANAANADERVVVHSGTVRWNAYRQRWILIACQIEGKTSHLGEVWYAEAKQPTGPFAKAVKIATHDRMSFYNVCHHDFLDRDGGRTIHFEGTYTSDFSGNPHKTPRYNYNQVLYRLDLDALALRMARVE